MKLTSRPVGHKLQAHAPYDETGLHCDVWGRIVMLGRCWQLMSLATLQCIRQLQCLLSTSHVSRMLCICMVL